MGSYHQGSLFSVHTNRHPATNFCPYLVQIQMCPLQNLYRVRGGNLHKRTSLVSHPTRLEAHLVFWRLYTHSSRRGGLPGRGLSPGQRAPPVAGSTHTASVVPPLKQEENQLSPSCSKGNATNPGLKPRPKPNLLGDLCELHIATVAKEVKKIFKLEMLKARKLHATLLALGRQNVADSSGL